MNLAKLLLWIFQICTFHDRILWHRKCQRLGGWLICRLPLSSITLPFGHQAIVYTSERPIYLSLAHWLLLKSPSHSNCLLHLHFQLCSSPQGSAETWGQWGAFGNCSSQCWMLTLVRQKDPEAHLGREGRALLGQEARIPVGLVAFCSSGCLCHHSLRTDNGKKWSFHVLAF